MKKLSTNERKTKENNKYNEVGRLELVISLITAVLSLVLVVISSIYVLNNDPSVFFTIGLGVVVAIVVVRSLDDVLKYINK